MLPSKAVDLERLYQDMHPVFATHADLLQKEVSDVTEYIYRIMMILENETEMFTQFLNTCPLIDQESEIKKMQLVWQSEMVERKVKFLENGFRQLLEEDCQKCLHRCFDLLRYVSTENKIATMFGEFISRQAFLALSILSGDDQSDFHTYVSKLIALRQHFCHLTVVSFEKDDDMCELMTKAFHDVLHNTEDPSLARGPKLVAMYWDQSLRKNSLTEAAKELSESLKLCAASYGVAKYVEEHIKLVFHRLVNDCCYHYRLEAMVIKVLIAGLDAEHDDLMQRGLRAMQDLSIKPRLNDMYQRYTDACCRTKRLIPTSITLIQENLWAHVFVMHQESTCVLPAFCGKSIAHFEKFYATKFIKRRLKWAPHLSTAVVAVNLSGRSCEVRVSLFGVAILFCFQERDLLEMKTIQEELMMKPLVLIEEVKLLIYHGALKMNSTNDLTMDSVVTLNKNFPVEKADIESKISLKPNLIALRKAQRIAECKRVSRERHMELHHPKDAIPSLPGALASASNVACVTNSPDEPFTCTHGSAPVVLKVSGKKSKTPKATEKKPEAKKTVKILVCTKKRKDVEKSPEIVVKQTPKLDTDSEASRQNDGRLFFEAISEMEAILQDSLSFSADSSSDCLPIHKAMMSCLKQVPPSLKDAKVPGVVEIKEPGEGKKLKPPKVPERKAIQREKKKADRAKVKSEEKKLDNTMVSDEITTNPSTNDSTKIKTKTKTKIPRVKDEILKVAQGENPRVPKQGNISCKEPPKTSLENITEEVISESDNPPLATKNENSSIKERVRRAVDEAVDIAEKHYLTQSDEHKPNFGSFCPLLDAIPEWPDVDEKDNPVFKSYKEQLIKELALTEDVFGLLDGLFSDDEDKDTEEDGDNTETFKLPDKVSDCNCEIIRHHGLTLDPALNTTALEDLPGHEQSKSRARRKIRQSLNRKEKQNKNSATAAQGEAGVSNVASPSVHSEPTRVHDSETQLKITAKPSKIEPRIETKTSQSEVSTKTLSSQATKTEPGIESDSEPIIIESPRISFSKILFCRGKSRGAEYYNQIRLESEREQRMEQLQLEEILRNASSPKMESDEKANNPAALTQDQGKPITIDELNQLMASVFVEERQDFPAEVKEFSPKEDVRRSVKVEEFSSEERDTKEAEEIPTTAKMPITEKIEPQKKEFSSEESDTKEPEEIHTTAKMPITEKIEPQKKECSSEERDTKEAEEIPTTAKMPITEKIEPQKKVQTTEEIPAYNPKAASSKALVQAPPSEPLTVERVPPIPAPRRSLILNVAVEIVPLPFPRKDLTNLDTEPVGGSDPVDGNKSLNSSTVAEGLSVKESSTSILEIDSSKSKCCIFKKCSPLSKRPALTSSIFDNGAKKDARCTKISTTVTTSSPTQSSTLVKDSPLTGMCNANKVSKKSSTPQKKCSCMKDSCLSSSDSSTGIASSEAKASSSVKTSAPGKSTSTRDSATGDSTTAPCQLCEEAPCPAGRLRHRVQHPRVLEIKKWKN